MLGKVVLCLAVFGLVTTGAIDVQKTAQYISRVVVVMLNGGQSQQQYEPPFQQEYYQPTEAQEQ